MPRVLQINASLHGDDAASSQLADDVAARLAGASRPRRRDLARDPIPHLDADTFAAFSVPAADRSEAQRARVALSDRLIGELRDAEVLVLGVPMYNFGLPSPLKAWFDHVARAGETFRYTADGPRGLLEGRRAVVVATRGGHHHGTARDTQTAHLKTLLAFLGYGPIDFIHAEGLALGDDARRQSLDTARQAGQRLAA